MSEKHPYRIYAEPELENPSLVVGWTEDAGKLGPRVTDYLSEKLGGKEFAEIEPAGFFPLRGVSVESDVAQFPESRFYCCQQENLVILKSSPPRFGWYGFLNSILDVAQGCCHAKELYTVGGMVSAGAHTTPRELLAVANSPGMREALAHYSVVGAMSYETPPSQRPTLNSFLLWVAKRRNVAAASLWVPIPFYLVAVEDPQASRKTVDFLNRRLDLGVDFADLDEDVLKQNESIAQLRMRSPEVNEYIGKLESNLSLTQEENETLVTVMEELFRVSD